MVTRKKQKAVARLADVLVEECCEAFDAWTDETQVQAKVKEVLMQMGALKALESGDSVFHVRIALLQEYLGRLREAERSISRAIAADPDNSDYKRIRSNIRRNRTIKRKRREVAASER